MLDLKEIEWAISQLEKGESSYPAYGKLADLYVIRDKILGGHPVESFYSKSSAPPEQVENRITYKSNTEFSEVVYGRNSDEIWPIIDELMEVLRVTNPRLYDGVMRVIQ